MLPAETALYTPMGVHTLLIWPTSPTGTHKPSLIQMDHLLIDEPVVGGLALTSTCSSTLSNV